MSDIIINPVLESRHFFLNQNCISKNVGSSFNFLEYTSGQYVTPTSQYFDGGYIRNSKHTYGFYNVDLRAIIGDDMYKKYNNFYLSLNTVYILNPPNNSPSQNRLFYIKINGLPFINQKNSKEIIFTSVQGKVSSRLTSVLYPLQQFFKFSKVESALMEIQLFYQYSDAQLDIGIDNVTNSILSNVSFGFSIYPCEN